MSDPRGSMSFRPAISNFPLTIYEAKFREKLRKNFQKDFSPNLTRHDKRRDGGHPEGRAEGQVQAGRAGVETKLALEVRAGLGLYAEMPERRLQTMSRRFCDRCGTLVPLPRY
jgi:hypothetical protein